MNIILNTRTGFWHKNLAHLNLTPTDDTFDCIVAMKTLNSGTTITLRLKQYRLNGNTIVTNPHNDFLLVFAETGIFGILCYLGLFATLLYKSLFLIKNAKSQSAKRMFFCLLSFVVGYLFIAFFDFPLDRIEHQILLLTVFGISNSYYLKFKNTPNNLYFSNRLKNVEYVSGKSILFKRDQDSSKSIFWIFRNFFTSSNSGLF